MKICTKIMVISLLVLCLTIGTSSVSFANATNPSISTYEENSTFVISEYDLYKDLTQKSDFELKVNGLELWVQK